MDEWMHMHKKRDDSSHWDSGTAPENLKPWFIVKQGALATVVEIIQASALLHLVHIEMHLISNLFTNRKSKNISSATGGQYINRNKVIEVDWSYLCRFPRAAHRACTPWYVHQKSLLGRGAQLCFASVQKKGALYVPSARERRNASLCSFVFFVWYSGL